jgi:hypothetical protein
MSDDLDSYLGRSLNRMETGALDSAKSEAQAICQRAAARGRLQSGATLKQLAEMHLTTFRTTATRMAKAIFESAGHVTPELAHILERPVRSLRMKLSNSLKGVLLRAFPNAPNPAIAAAGNVYEIPSEAFVAAVLDDFLHEMSDGSRMKREQSMITASIINSPGAAIQAGAGNVQTVVSTNYGADELRKAIAEFLADQHFLGLDPAKQDDLRDMAEMITVELEKPEPNSSRIAKWGRRLVDAATALGIGIAVNGISKLLFG